QDKSHVYDWTANMDDQDVMKRIARSTRTDYEDVFKQELPASFPAILRDVLLRCVDQDKSARPSAKEVVTCLETCLGTQTRMEMDMDMDMKKGKGTSVHCYRNVYDRLIVIITSDGDIGKRHVGRSTTANSNAQSQDG